MIGASYGPASDFEVILAAVALIGVMFSGLNVRDALTDVRLLDTKDLHNGKRLVAVVVLRVEAARLIMQTVFAGVGIALMTIPEVDQSLLPATQTAIDALTRWGILISATLMLFQTFENRRMRQYFLQTSGVVEEGGSP